MTNNCTKIAPGKTPQSWQQRGLNLVSRLNGGRDVVIAIDLTESVGLNAEGRLRLTQIIEDSLQSGDTVYLLPFASQVNPLQADINPITPMGGIKFRGKSEDIEKILNTLPFDSAINLSNTDIQNAELFVYRELAQLNQCRLANNDAIKPQSVVWLTDAPLLASPGIDSDTWIETPANSPFRVAESEASQDRQNWLNALPIEERSQKITTNDNRTYQLSIVDLAPTVQEFCTPAPGGKETCLVAPYLFQMLWLPTTILGLGIVAGLFWLKYLISLQKKWKIRVYFESDDTREQQTCYLRNKQKITIGDNSLNGIPCLGEDVRGYIIRKGNKIFLKPTSNTDLFYSDRKIVKEIEITRNSFTINCPLEDKDFEIRVRVYK